MRKILIVITLFALVLTLFTACSGRGEHRNESRASESDYRLELPPSENPISRAGLPKLPDNAYLFAERLQKILDNDLADGIERDTVTIAYIVDIDGNDTAGMLVIKTHLGVSSRSTLYYIYDNELHQLPSMDTLQNPGRFAGRISCTNRVAIQVRDNESSGFELLKIYQGKPIIELQILRPVCACSSDCERNVYYYNRTSQPSREISAHEFNEVIENYGLHSIFGYHVMIDDDRDKILSMTN